MTRFFEDLFTKETAPPVPAEVRSAAPAPPSAAAQPKRQVPAQAGAAERKVAGSNPPPAQPRRNEPAAARPSSAKPDPAPEPAKSAPAAQTVAAPAAAAIPTTPEAAVERVNAYFNGIDQLTASFVQTSPSGRLEGTLALKRPGHLRFAYAPPSTLEIVSDGRSVAIRDKRLGTNDVYPASQTPLKFLLQEQFDLARDTKVRDVQTSPDGVISIRFDDSSTLGGTSRVTLRFDARANRLRQWTVVDAQGTETTVVLSDLNVVRR